MTTLVSTETITLIKQLIEEGNLDKAREAIKLLEDEPEIERELIRRLKRRIEKAS